MRSAVVGALGVFCFVSVGSDVGRAQGLMGGAPRGAGVSRNEAAVATSPMQAPVLGFVSVAPPGAAMGRTRIVSGAGWSRATVRLYPIAGVPGSAVISGPVALPAGVTGIHFAPNQSFALVETDLRESVGLLQLSGSQPVLGAALPAGITAPDLVSFSPGGSAAALLSRAEGRLAVLNGLPGAPQLAREITGAALPEGIVQVAAADDGATVLAGTSDGRVVLLAADGSQRLLYTATELGGIAFEPVSTDAVVFDRGVGQAMLIANAGAAPAVRLLAENLPKQNGTAVLQVDARAAFVSGVGAKDVWRIDLQTQQVQDIHLPSALSTMQPLRAPGRYLLSAQAGQPAWVLDTSGETSAVYFVPRQIAADRVR